MPGIVDPVEIVLDSHVRGKLQGVANHRPGPAGPKRLLLGLGEEGKGQRVKVIGDKGCR